jgi:hypothetical protein
MINQSLELVHLNAERQELDHPTTTCERLSVVVLTFFALTVFIVLLFALLPVLHPGYLDLLCQTANCS